MNKALFILLSLFVTSILSQENADLKTFLLEIPIVDGVVGYGGGKKSIYDKSIGAPDCTSDSQGKSVKERTYINIGSQNISRGEDLLDRINTYLERVKGAVLIKSELDIDSCLKEKKYGIIYYCQKHFPLEGDISNIDRWYKKGLRILQVHYGKHDILNLTKQERLGHSGYETKGLTKLGVDVVNRMMDLGMIVDVSHCNQKTILETSEIALGRGVPILGNHTGAVKAKDIFSKDLSNRDRVMCNHLRLWTDKSIKAVAKTGGVIGVMLYPGWVSCESTFRDNYTISANVEQIIAHIDYIAKLVGVDHVGIATDGYLDGTPAREKFGDNKIDTPERMYYIAELLLEKGYSRNDVAKILGGNFLRVYRKVL